MKYLVWLLFIALTACQTNTPPVVAVKPVRALGLLEVRFGTSQMSTQATFTPIGSSQVQPQALLDETQIAFTPSSFQVVQTASRRFLNASFSVKNSSAATINNLTLVAYVKSGNQAQTAIQNAQNFIGAGLDLDAFVQNVRPAPGMNNATTVNSDLADLMLFTENEISTLQTEATSVLQGTGFLLPYGYVARNASHGRDITVNASNPTGAVNIGLNIPASNDPVATPYRFSMTFVVFENPTATTRVVQGLEEQASDSTVTQRVTQTSASEVVVLQGSSYPTSGVSLKVLCDVRTAGTAASPTAVLVASSVLAVGQSLNLSGTEAATRCIKNTEAAKGEYIAVPSNLALTGNQSISLLARSIVTATVTPYSAPALRPLVTSPQPLIETRPVQENLDALLRRPDSRITSTQHIQNSSLRPQVITPGIPVVGDQMTLNVASGCSGTLDLRTGTVKAVGNRLIVIADNDNPAGGFTDAQYGLIATTGGTGTDNPAYGFDEDVYDSVVNAFGTPADVDNNQRVIAFFTKAVNELDPPASSSVNLGYFSSRDLFSSAPATCPSSNQGEIIYMLVPDPTGVVNSNERAVSFVAENTPRTLGAEFQRLINASRRIYITQASLEESWLETGLGDIAEELIFYQNSVGLTPLSNIVVGNLTTRPNVFARVAAFNAFANPNFGRLRIGLQRPEIRSPFAAVSNTSTDTLGQRGALWNFLRYVADRKVPSGSQNAFWASLVDSNLTGKANLQNAIGAGNDLNTWLRDWAMAIYADDAVVGASAVFSQSSWNYRSLYTAFNVSYQLLIRPLADNTALTLNYVPSGSSHARFAVSAATTANMLLRVGSNPPSATVNMTLMRVR